MSVEARARERARFDSVAQTSTFSLSARDLIGAPGLLEADVMRVVQLLPGTVARNDYSIGYNVRGGESDQNLVRLDGMTILNPSHLGGLFSTFDVNAVDHADFLTGGFPAEYSGRLSSVLDVALRSRQPRASSWPCRRVDALGQGPRRGAGGPRVDPARRPPTYADQMVKAFTDNELPYAFTDLVGKLHYPYGANGDVAITGYWGRDALLLNLISDSAGRTPVDLALAWGNRLLGVTWRHPMGAAVLEQRLSYTGFASDLELRPDLVRYDNPASVWSAMSSLSFTGRNHHVKLGASFEGYDLRYTIVNPAIPNRAGTAGQPLTRVLQHALPARVWAAFVDDQWRPTPALLLRAGIRAERVAGADVTTVAPRAAFKVFLSPNLALTGSLGRYYQVIQSLADQDCRSRSTSSGWARTAGFPWRTRIMSWRESSTGWGLARARRFPLRRITRRFGASSARNPASRCATRATYSSRSRGTPGAWTCCCAATWAVRAAGSPTASSRPSAVAGAESYPPAHDRRHSLNVVVQSPGPLGSAFGLRFGFGSPLPYTALVGSWSHGEYSPTSGTFTPGGNTEPLPGPLNGARYPAYSRLDAGFRWHARKWGLDWQPYLDAVNLLNRRNLFTYFFDSEATPPTRTAFYQLPIFLAAGLEVAW